MKIGSCCDHITDTVVEWECIKAEADRVGKMLVNSIHDVMDVIEDETAIEIPMSIETARKLQQIAAAAIAKAILEHVEE